MGLLPKYKIEELKRQKKEAKAAKKRKENVKSKIVRFLIVCEGERTEPQYFKSLLKNKYSKVIEYDVAGEGMSTCALVNKTLEIKNELEKKTIRNTTACGLYLIRTIFRILTKLLPWLRDILLRRHGATNPSNCGISYTSSFLILQ